MAGKEKDPVAKHDDQSEPKKSYTTPQLTVHGSVHEITREKGLVLGDGFVSGSTLG